MTQKTDFVSANLPLLEGYFLAPDRNKYLSSLQQLDAKLLRLLLGDLPNEPEAIFRYLGVPYELQTQIKGVKWMSQLRSAKNQEEVKAAIKSINTLHGEQHFDYVKPTELGMQQANQAQNLNLKSKLELEQNISQFLLLKLQEKKTLRQFDEYGLVNLPREAIEKLSFEEKLILIDKKEIIQSLDEEFAADFLLNMLNVIKEQKKVDLSALIDRNFFEQVTEEQIKKIKQKNPKLMDCPAYYKTYFQYKYGYKISKFKNNQQLSSHQLEEKRALCDSAIKELGQFNSPHTRSLQASLLEDILLLDLLRNDPSEKLFVQYLTNLDSRPCHLLRKEYSTQIQNRRRTQDYPSHSQYDMINKYLTGLFKKENYDHLIKTLQPYIDGKVLAQTKAKILLLRGESNKIEDIHNLFTQSELEEFKKKEITLLSKNKEHYKVSDKVELHFMVRNLKEISIKIYMVDLEKHCIESTKPFDLEANLKYLTTPICKILQVQRAVDPYAENVIIEKLDELDDKAGLFFVQLESEGITSRAVIRKGLIVCQNRQVEPGHQLSFFNQDGVPIEHLSLWIAGRKEEVKGKYIIPNGPAGSQKIIAVSNGFSQLLNVNIQAQVYSFEVGYIYHTETFVMGSKARVILHPSLQLGQTRIPLSRLNKVKVTVESDNNLNVKSNLTFEGIVFKDCEDYLLQFPVNSYLKIIQIKVEADIEKIDRTKVNLSHQKSISIPLYQENRSFVDLYLERNEFSSHLQILGKNGQPIPFAQVNLSLLMMGYNESDSVQLYTNEQGRIDLGSLRLVRKMTANIEQNGQRISRSWRINDYFETVSYGNCSTPLTLKAGETLSLPLPCCTNVQSDIIAIRKRQSGALENVVKQVKIAEDRLVIEKLEKGVYTLNLLKIGKRLTLKVIEGEHWNNPNKVLNDGGSQVTDLTNHKMSWISLGKSEIKETEETFDVTVKFNLPSNCTLPANPRVHVLPTNFVTPAISDFFSCSLFNKSPQCHSLQLIRPRCAYFSNKTLSDEAAYVLNRNGEPKNIGNNLQKPHIFTVRELIRVTEDKQIQMRKEKNYESMDKCADLRNSSVEKMMAQCRMASNMMQCQNSFFGAQGASLTIEKSLSTHNSFLGQTGYVVANIRDNSATFSIPKGYNCFDAYFITDTTAIKRTYLLPNKTPTKKLSLTHIGTPESDEKTGLTISRQVIPLRTGESFKVSRDSVWKAVTVANLENYAKIRQVKLPEWLLNWHSYSAQRKLKEYGESMCHELNIFLKLQDTEFFQNVVKPFISNKVEKTFVDLCLLEDVKAVQYRASHLFARLNQFEKVLLVGAMVRNGMKQQAEQIVSALELIQKKTKRQITEFNTKFQIILNAKNLERPMLRLRGGPGEAQTSVQNSNALFGACFSAISAPMMAYDMMMQECDMDRMVPEGCMADSISFTAAQDKYKKGFQQMEKTKEYTETTYEGVNNPSQFTRLVPSGELWVQLAAHTIRNTKEEFLSDKFLHINTKQEFILAYASLPKAINADFELTNEGNQFIIKAKSSFLVFVKQMKSVPFEKKFGVLINQRFYNPDNRYIYENDGTLVEKQVEQFVIRRAYTVQTIVTNTSGTALELQILLDIPQGAIPLHSHEFTQVVNFTFQPYTSSSFERTFYFPSQGEYSFYSANACRGQQILSKGNTMGKLVVRASETVLKLESLDDVLRSGKDQDILNFLNTRNIFDENVFNVYSILWKLKDKTFFEKCIEILRRRKYYQSQIWRFGLHHQNKDVAIQSLENMRGEVRPKYLQAIFEYFPYYSSRTHSFMDRKKSTIRNKEFKETYCTFLLTGLLDKVDCPAFKIALVYYLLLQDRILQANDYLSRISQDEQKQHQIQFDYVRCFLDMYLGQDTDFALARKISAYYKNYKIESWRKLFGEVSECLQKTKEDMENLDDTAESVTFGTTVVDEGHQLRVNLPANTEIKINFVQINLELYFSEFPFTELSSLPAVYSSVSLSLPAGASRVEVVQREQYKHLKNMLVEVYEFKKDVLPTKVSTFLWNNPEVQVKFNERAGTLKVFYKGKKCSTAYVKVYSKGKDGDSFYRDGYLDISGSFRYAMSEASKVKEFAILVLTDFGGIISKVKPPSHQNLEE